MNGIKKKKKRLLTNLRGGMVVPFRNKGRPSIQNGFPFLVNGVFGQAGKFGVFSLSRRALVADISVHSPVRSNVD
jgi:hypothetical protein